MNRKKIVSVIAVLLAVLMVLSMVLSAIPVAYADELDDLKSQKQELSNQVKECQDRLTALREQQANVLEQKAALDEQNRLANEQLELIKQEIASYDKLIAQKAEEVKQAKEKEQRQLEKYQARVRAMEENGGYNILALVVCSDNFSQLLTAMDDMGEIMESDRALQKSYVAAREETEAIKAEYEAEKAQYEAEQAELKKEQEEIGKQILQANEQLEELAEEIDKAIKEYEAAEAAEEAAAGAIANMVAELARRKAEEAAAAQQAAQQAQQKVEEMTQANADAVANGQQPPYTEEEIQDATTDAGYNQVQSGSSTGLMWPVPCSTRVTSRFGYRSDPFTGDQKFHSGIDIDGFGNDGNIIVASAEGTVVTASFDSAYGNYVVIDHGSTTTLYAHMSGMAVSAGSYVTQGQTIGYLGSTGRSTGTHCHYEVFVDGSRVDPTQYFSGLSYYNC